MSNPRNLKIFDFTTTGWFLMPSDPCRACVLFCHVRKRYEMARDTSCEWGQAKLGASASCAITDNVKKSMKINENPWKSMKINENK